MTLPSAPPNSPDRAQSRWLGRVARSGGAASHLAIALPLFAGGLLLPQAWWLAHTLHLAIVEGKPPADLLWPVAVIGILLLVRIGLGVAAEGAASVAAERIKLRLRRAIVGTLLDAPPAWTATRSAGALAAVVVEHIEAMDGYLTRYLPAVVQAAILPLAFAAVLLPFDWVAAVLLLVVTPLIPVFMALAGWGAEGASRRQARALGRLSGYFTDRIGGIVTLKLLNRDEAETEAVGRASEELRQRTLRVMRIAFLSSAVLEFFAALGVAGVALYVGLTFLGLVDLRGMPLGLEAGLFCLLMAPEVFQPLRLLAMHYHDRAAARAAVAEISAQLGSLPVEPVRRAAPDPAETRKEAPALSLKGVSIAAPDGRSLLTAASLAVAAGAHIAILGASGVGKSTLLEALAGLRPYSGSIEVDGTELAALPAQALRDLSILVGQRPTMFAGSIADNIRLGRRTACATAVRLAAQRARVMEFAAELPDGLDTPLGEGGLGLSGGEAHRVALARLYLRDPGLLLVDEPTAHLDAATEARVVDGLVEFARGRTMIVVTHSAAVAARMGQCYRLAGGQLVPALRMAPAGDPLRGAA